MQRIIKEIPRRLAPGLSGLRADYLLQATQRKHRKLFEETAEIMARLAQRAIAGDLPMSLARWICRGRGVPLRKKDGGVRPLVVGEVIRAAISKVVLARCGEAACESLPAVQLRFSPGQNGLQAAVRTARYWAQNLHCKALLKVDISNAYNTLDGRHAAMEPTTCTRSWLLGRAGALPRRLWSAATGKCYPAPLESNKESLFPLFSSALGFLQLSRH